jgi:hypothetical protein
MIASLIDLQEYETQTVACGVIARCRSTPQAIPAAFFLAEVTHCQPDVERHRPANEVSFGRLQLPIRNHTGC